MRSVTANRASFPPSSRRRNSRESQSPQLGKSRGHSVTILMSILILSSMSSIIVNIMVPCENPAAVLWGLEESTGGSNQGREGRNRAAVGIEKAERPEGGSRLPVPRATLNSYVRTLSPRFLSTSPGGIPGSGSTLRQRKGGKTAGCPCRLTSLSSSSKPLKRRGLDRWSKSPVSTPASRSP